jgi:hypothetical protein
MAFPANASKLEGIYMLHGLLPKLARYLLDPSAQPEEALA